MWAIMYSDLQSQAMHSWVRYNALLKSCYLNNVDSTTLIEFYCAEIIDVLQT